MHRTKFTAAKEAKRRSREAFGQVQTTKRIPSKRRKLVDKFLRELEREDKRGYPKGFK